ncbi:D-alanyl-D-alanine carboxypeptidase family protein [Zafaria sp. J156]|uniref:D-alanyl-D-alanine carboxypeptidase family protein n=1 Tax=Zafaria sp. J156 TaxID=3116490 RepID=UPI002E78DBC0|nr:D-alanyl-D-alanine carboxypeptidase family protein [Zafaria sp. J156]MEE1620491.1 D-alanyl-D-alanine carboxypeptidase family protein [Zafaria sp. J156]
MSSTTPRHFGYDAGRRLPLPAAAAREVRSAAARAVLAVAAALFLLLPGIAPAQAAGAVATPAGAGPGAGWGSAPTAAPASYRHVVPAAKVPPLERNPRRVAMLVNKDHPLAPARFAPSLAALPGGFRAHPDAAAAFKRMAADARRAGVDIRITSAYRSYATQASLFASYSKRYGAAYAARISARPGTSEHQTGLAIDVGNASKACALQACFAKTPVGRWVSAYGHKYGFIIRYPSGQEATTGYSYEPWHLRYVGPRVAQDMAARKVPTLEHYYGIAKGQPGARAAAKPAAQATAKPAAGRLLATTANLNMRSGPGTGHRIVTTLSKGTRVTVTGAARNGWHPVKYGTRTGWMSGKYLK